MSPRCRRATGRSDTVSSSGGTLGWGLVPFFDKQGSSGCGKCWVRADLPQRLSYKGERTQSLG